jgi:hypothetical protein
VSALLLLFVVGLSQGLIHSVGPDHCAALATLGLLEPGRRRQAMLKVAFRFAAGHAFMLGGLVTACLLIGVGLSETFEKWAEIGSGVALVVLAATLLFFPSALAHGHPHLPGHDHDHRHVRVGGTMGALMAVSGVRSLLLALPPVLAGGSFHLKALSYIPGFGLGVFLGMGVIGLLFAEASTRLSDTLAVLVRRGVAVFSAGLGIVWIAVRL